MQSIRRLCIGLYFDESAAVLVEYAVFMSIVSAAAFATTISFSLSSSDRANTIQTQLNDYAINPQPVECDAGGSSYC